MKNRLELAQYFADQGYHNGAEIGVFDGYFSLYLCKIIPSLHLYAVDAWKVYDGYRDHMFQKNMDAAYELAKKRLEKYGPTIIKKFSVDASRDIPNGMLDFVYIDANHEYSSVKQDIELWTPKVRIGGTVAGDDYYVTPRGNTGVILAVDEYVRKNRYILHITDWDMENEVEDNRQPAWYFTRTH